VVAGVVADIKNLIHDNIKFLLKKKENLMKKVIIILRIHSKQKHKNLKLTNYRPLYILKNNHLNNEILTSSFIFFIFSHKKKNETTIK